MQQVCYKIINLYMLINQPEVYPKVFLYRRLVKAKLFMDAHYAEPIEVNHIAGKACSSKYHFIRQFKCIYRKTPHQYLIKVRIDHAKELLADGMSVSAVCYAVGFESLSSFTHLFTRLAGLTPSAYLSQERDLREKATHSPLSFIPACFAHKSGWL